MYYLLTLIIIAVFLVFKYTKIIPYLRNTFKKKTTNLNSGNEITSSHHNTLPTIESFENPLILNNFTSKNIYRNPNLGITIKLNLVYPDPQYEYHKKEENMEKETDKNFTWKPIFKKNICNSKLGKCGCELTTEGENICGVALDDKIYECASPCPECNKCHLRKDTVEINYDDFCYLAETEKQKKRCQDYQDRIIFTKKNCFGSETQDTRVVKIEEKCKIFIPVRFNSYLVGDDIFFNLEKSILNDEIKSTIKDIKLDKLTLKNNSELITVSVNNFFHNLEESYFFIEAEEEMIGTNITVEVKGSIIFKDASSPKIYFTVIQIINIYPSIGDKTINSYLQNEDILSLQRNKFLKSKKAELPKFYVDSVDDDRFADNYLGENKYYQCHKFQKYTVYNPIKFKAPGTYKRKNLLDNPQNWKNRNDINRPWDYIIE